MDLTTSAVYDARAAHFTTSQRAVQPDVLYHLVQTFFHAGAPTADIGCGSGRDVAWLVAHGFPTTGYDASPEMLHEARRAFPAHSFTEAQLPELAVIPDGAYINVLCSAVLMHSAASTLIDAALAFARVLQPGGRLVLSYRASTTDTEREQDGRLFTPIPPGKLLLLLEAAGLTVLYTSVEQDTHRAPIRWNTLVAEKATPNMARGLERIQAVLVQDRKVATYKLALIRALCVISRTAAHVVRWGDAGVLVPLWCAAVQWLRFYWPLFTEPTFIAQIHGETAESIKPIAFRKTIADLATTFGPTGLYDLLQQIETMPQQFREPLKIIADTIRAGPVTYAGTTERLFTARAAPRRPERTEDQFGWMVVPEPMWLDIARFDHWIEDSVVLRWARLTAEMNLSEAHGLSRYIPLLLRDASDVRDTVAIHRLLDDRGLPLTCVWSGQPIVRDYAVDHMIPYTAWGNNDLWNVLPTLPTVNSAKRDALPTRQLLLRQRDSIVDDWHIYQQVHPSRFAAQVHRALGCDIVQPGWEHIALGGLQEIIERLATTRQLPRWEP